MLYWVRGVNVTASWSCPALGDPMDCSPPGSSVHGVLQARMLEWVAVPISRGSSQPRNWTQVSCIAGGTFTIWVTREWETAIIYTVSFHLYGHKVYTLWFHLGYTQKDKSLVIQLLLKPSCRTLEKFYKIAPSNEENSRLLPWKY